MKPNLLFLVHTINYIEFWSFFRKTTLNIYDSCQALLTVPPCLDLGWTLCSPSSSLSPSYQYIHHWEAASTGAEDSDQICGHRASPGGRQVERAHEPPTGQGNHHQWTASQGPAEEWKHKEVSMAHCCWHLLLLSHFVDPSVQSNLKWIMHVIGDQTGSLELYSLPSTPYHCYDLLSWINWPRPQISGLKMKMRIRINCCFFWGWMTAQAEWTIL